MPNANRHLSLLAAACAMAMLAACAKPVDDTRNNVVAPATEPDSVSAPTPAPTPAAAVDGNAWDAGVPGRLVAHGNEPFWAVEVEGSSLIWKTPELPDGKKLTAERSDHADGATFTGKDGTKDFSLDITIARCSDGMSDESFDFTATWVQGDQRMTGCARIVD